MLKLLEKKCEERDVLAMCASTDGNLVILVELFDFSMSVLVY